MANQYHLEILKQGVIAWNKWRDGHQDIRPDLTEVDLSNANLKGANLSNANLRGAFLGGTDLRGADLTEVDLSRAFLGGTDLRGAVLIEADLSNANLRGAFLSRAFLRGAFLRKADLSEVDLSRADLGETNLSNANLSNANLNNANLSWSNISEANCREADLTGCRIYAISAWNVHLEKTIQTGLSITRYDEATITVDNLEVAQFIYLLLNNKKIREVIDTITSKVVLILGRFTEERKKVLDALRDELRKRNYSPVVFDFEKPANRDLTETVSTLAHLARFILVDLTDPSSAPHEVATIIPQTVVPVQPLLTLQPLMVEGKGVERREYAMFDDLRRRYHWVLPTFRYQDTADLLTSFQEHIIESAEQKAQELAKR